MVTHDREDALVSADVIALMRSGSVVQSGTPAEVYLKPISADVAESTGDVVTIPAVQSNEGRYFSVLHRSDGLPQDGSKGELLVRPEEIRVSAHSTASGVTATIARINYYGHDALLELEFAGMAKLIRARVAGPMNFEVGQTVFVEHQGPIRWVSGNATRE
jgi:ABC-type Fe3+/spermidine/putrescine transport system ATPase subunit